MSNHIFQLKQALADGKYQEVLEFVQANPHPLYGGSTASATAKCVNAGEDPQLQAQVELDHRIDNLDFGAMTVDSGGPSQLPAGGNHGDDAAMDAVDEAPAVDEDGWETVGKRVKGRRRG